MNTRLNEILGLCVENSLQKQATHMPLLTPKGFMSRWSGFGTEKEIYDEIALGTKIHGMFSHPFINAISSGPGAQKMAKKIIAERAAKEMATKQRNFAQRVGIPLGVMGGAALGATSAALLHHKNKR
jgi:hypothetical protein